MKITLEIPDEQKDRVVDAICYLHGYEDVLVDMEGTETPNPQTKAKFAKAQIYTIIKNMVKTYEVRQAEEQATANARASVDADIDFG